MELPWLAQAAKRCVDAVYLILRLPGVGCGGKRHVDGVYIILSACCFCGSGVALRSAGPFSSCTACVGRRFHASALRAALAWAQAAAARMAST